MQRLASLALLVSVTLLLPACASVPAGNPQDGYAVHGFVGKSSQEAAPGVAVTLLDADSGSAVATTKANLFGKYVFQGLRPGRYLVRVEKVEVPVTVADANVRQDIDLSNPSGAMDYAAAGKKELAEQLEALATGKVPPAGPNDEALARQLAGTWWGYSGSTETKIGLCPDGSYHDFSESSYSGTMTDGGGNQTGAWGAAGQSGGQGSWVVQGTLQSGTITVRYADGSTGTIHYEQHSDPNCLLFDGRTLCRTASECE